MYIIKYIDKKKAVLSAVFALLYSVSSVVFLYQIKNFSEIAGQAHATDELIKRILISILLALASIAFMYFQRQINDTASIAFQQMIRNKLFDSLQSNSYEKISRKGFTSISTNVIQDASACSGMIYGNISGSLTAALVWLSVFGVLIYENAVVSVMILAVALAISVFIYYFRFLIRKLYTEYANAREVLNGKINELIRCKDILNNGKSYEIERANLNTCGITLQKKWLKCNVTTPTIFSSIEIAILLSYLIVFLLPRNTGTVMSITTAQLLLFTTYIPQLWSRYSSLSSLFSSFVGANQYSERIKNSIENSSIQPEGTETVQIVHQPTIQAANLFFSFGDKVIFDNLNFSFEGPGVVYVTGKSGRGKSTLFNLMTGLYQNYSGSLTIDGVEFRNLTSHSLEKCIGIVHQDTYIIDDTAFNNIVLFDDSISWELIESVAKQYGLLELLGDLNSRSFNAGQKRVISILRVLVRDPAVILFDEVTAGLDSFSEQFIAATIEKVSKQKLCFVIEHKAARTRHEREINLGDNQN